MSAPIWLAAAGAVVFLPPGSRWAAPRVLRVPAVCAGAASSTVVPIERTQPSPALEPREVIDSVMAALHRSNWDTPSPYYGFEVALRFLAPTHMAKQRGAKPGGYARFMRQPHKIQQITWSEYRFEGDLVMLPGSKGGPEEAFQMVSVRSSPTEEWSGARWKLVRANLDYGESTLSQWMVEAVFAQEPDQPTDAEYLTKQLRPPPRSDADGVAAFYAQLRELHGEEVDLWVAPQEAPREVVDKVMAALRADALGGAAVATHYCSPQNRASELSPEVFARYLSDPWYSILTEWDEKEEDDEEDEEEELESSTEVEAEVEVLVRRQGEESFTMISWRLSLYNAQWLIDSINII